MQRLTQTWGSRSVPAADIAENADRGRPGYEQPRLQLSGRMSRIAEHGKDEARRLQRVCSWR